MRTQLLRGSWRSIPGLGGFRMHGHDQDPCQLPLDDPDVPKFRASLGVSSRKLTQTIWSDALYLYSHTTIIVQSAAMADDSSADIRSSRPHSRDSRDPHTPEGQIRPTGASFPGLFPPLAPTATSSSHVSANDRSHGSPSTSTSTTHTDGSSGGRSMTTTESHAGSTSPAHAALYAPYASSSSSSSSSSKPPPIPEKCLTFCTSRADAPSMCRMFCLRKKAMVASRDEELARLRPKSHRSATSSISNNDDAEPTRSAWTSFSPLASLRRTLSPYSFVYVKGTATGVVGRYMEELESDDGHRDFGPESRHAEEKRGKEREIAWYSWGEEG